MPISNGIPGTNEMTGSSLGTTDATGDSLSALEAARGYPLNKDSPPPNVHGDRIFLVKIQHSRAQGSRSTDSFLIWDKTRSCVVYFFYDKDPRAFEQFRGEIEGPRGEVCGAAKRRMYRWAKRVGEWELSVCLDRVPDEGTGW